MSELSIKAMQLAERMQGTEFENTSIQDLVIECALALESKEPHTSVDKSDAWDAITEKNKIIAAKTTIISELVGALEELIGEAETANDAIDHEVNPGQFLSAINDAKASLTKAREIKHD